MEAKEHQKIILDLREKIDALRYLKINIFLNNYKKEEKRIKSLLNLLKEFKYEIKAEYKEFESEHPKEYELFNRKHFWI